MERPKISIITPSLNQGIFIEDTINSVLNQNYPNIEHIVIDGGSTDGTIDILKKYRHLKWVSEKDNGQSDAINKGFRLATGEIIAWLNSDDYYETDIFSRIADYFMENSDCNFLYGDITFITPQKENISEKKGHVMTYKNLIQNPDLVRQPGSFWRREILSGIGFLDEQLHLAMDLDYFLRIARNYTLHYLPYNLSYFRYYDECKSLRFRRKQRKEILEIIKKHANHPKLVFYRYLLAKFLWDGKVKIMEYVNKGKKR